MNYPILIKHDSHTFNISLAAIENDDDLIGFYFDDRGFPQRILKNSVYGKIVKMKLKKENITIKDVRDFVKLCY